MHLRHESGTEGTRFSYMWMCINIIVEKYIHTHKELWEGDSKAYLTAWKQKGWVRQGNPKGRMGEMWHPPPSLNAVIRDVFSKVFWCRCGWLRQNCHSLRTTWTCVSGEGRNQNRVHSTIAKCSLFSSPEIPEIQSPGQSAPALFHLLVGMEMGHRKKLADYLNPNEDIKIDVRFLNINRNKIKSWTTLRRSVFWVSWNKTITSLCSPRNSDRAQHVL